MLCASPLTAHWPLLDTLLKASCFGDDELMMIWWKHENYISVWMWPFGHWLAQAPVCPKICQKMPDILEDINGWNCLRLHYLTHIFFFIKLYRDPWSLAKGVRPSLTLWFGRLGLPHCFYQEAILPSQFFKLIVQLLWLLLLPQLLFYSLCWLNGVIVSFSEMLSS